MTRTRKALAAVVALIALTAATACTGSDGPSQPTVTATQQPTPAPFPPGEIPDIEGEHLETLGPNATKLRAGVIPFVAPAEWGEPTVGPYVEELYVVQDFTWWLGLGGALVNGIGMTPSQAAWLSGGETYEAHVAGVAEMLGSGDPLVPAEIVKSKINGVQASRMERLGQDDVLVVVYIFDLDDAYYEISFFSGDGSAGASPFEDPAEPVDAAAAAEAARNYHERLAAFEAAVATFSAP